jgi:hypothetical protein
MMAQLKAEYLEQNGSEHFKIRDVLTQSELDVRGEAPYDADEGGDEEEETGEEDEEAAAEE